MSTEACGITVNVPSSLHREVKEIIDAAGITMSQYIQAAIEQELKSRKGKNGMKKTRTLAFAVSEDLFARVKTYLVKHHMTQKEFVVGLIENALAEDEEAAEAEQTEPVEADAEPREDAEGDDEGVLETAEGSETQMVAEAGSAALQAEGNENQNS